MNGTTSAQGLRAPSIGSATEAGMHKARTGTRVATAYSEHAPGLARLAFLLTGDAWLAEDLVQEAFVRAVGRFVHLRRSEALHAYLRRTVVNLVGKHVRRAKLERAYVVQAAPGSRAASQPDVALQEELWCALRKLPHRQRAALVLRFYEDLSERSSRSCIEALRQCENR